MSELITQIIKQCQHKTAKETWEYLKFKIREFLHQFSKGLASEKELIIAQLSETVNIYGK